MSTDHIRYDVLAQEALRGVVRKVLSEVAKAGLPGEHHFYIAFDTGAAGVRISSKLRDRYPNEMTFVLQHQFWDLNVTDPAFEVGLSFDGAPERLLVPFSALRGFFDPTVQFGLQFDPQEAATEAGAEDTGAATPQDQRSAVSAIGSVAALPTGVESNDSEEVAAEPEATPELADNDSQETETEDVVVSLDAFRKKQ